MLKPEQSNHEESISATIPLPNSIVTVSTNLPILIADVSIDYLPRNQELTDISVIKAINNLSFFFDPRSYAIHVLHHQIQRGRVSEIFNPSSIIGNIAVAVLANYQPQIGELYPDLNAPAILIDPRKCRRVLHIGTNPQNEMEIFKNEVEKTWRHEREHFIQQFDPSTKQIREKYKKRQELTAYAVTGLLYSVFVLWAMKTCLYDRIPSEYLKTTVSFLTGLTILQLSRLSADYLWGHQLNPLEKNAEEQAINGKNLPNLFNFHFE